ncbi:MAG: AAA family ATPase [Pirellulaceae bacterium]
MIVENEQGRKAFEFQKGPIFTQICLADEINRATPKTQSALLETMQEGTITVAGHAATSSLDKPFLVLRPRTRSSRKGPIRCRKPNSIAFVQIGCRLQLA